MSAILGRICEVAVRYKIISYLYIGLANQHDRIWKGGTQSPPIQTAVYTEQFRKLQESGRYVIQVFGTKMATFINFLEEP